MEAPFNSISAIEAAQKRVKPGLYIQPAYMMTARTQCLTPYSFLHFTLVSRGELLKKVYLASCIEVGDIDTESIFIKEALKKRGIESSIENWDDSSIDWRDATLVISRTTSSYIFKPEKFIEWAKTVEETSTLWNPSPVIEWNYHKRYLMELQEQGIPMPETLLIPQDTEQSMNEILETIPWDDFIIKPCISAGSAGLKRFSKDSSDLETHFMNLNKHGFHQVFSFGEFDYSPCDTLVQPYLHEITENGEISLIFFGGEYSHAVIKKPPVGDFRAHPVLGADVQRYSPSTREVEVAYRSLEVVGHPIEFARIDMIPTESNPMIIEIELIDPFLFFDHFPETAESYADHIEDFIKTP